MPKDLAIVLNNGSVNSAVVTALAAQRFRPVMVYVQTDDPTAPRARAAWEQQVAHFKPYREYVLPLPAVAAAVPAPAAAAAADPRQQRPNRAPQLLELLPLLAAGARLAAAHQAAAISFGLRVGGQGDDLARATEYVQVWTELLQLPCDLPDLELAAPLLELEPWQVVDLAFQVAAPLERTWSCDEDGGDPCWACRGCRARDAAFQQAGKPDPLRTGPRRG